jgi:hypothetical protein
MNLIKIVSKYYLENDCCCGDTYESLEWYDTVNSKPTYEELEQLWTLYLEDEMREKRNKLLQESDLEPFQIIQGETNGLLTDKNSAIF